MKFTINRSAFTAKLNDVLRAISSKTTIPILTGLKMVVSPQDVTLTGSDADITIQTVMTTEDDAFGLTVDQAGSIVLPARFFSEIVKKLPDQQVTIEVSDGFQAQITSGSASFTINGQDAENYPRLPEIETTDTVKLAGDLFKEIIGQTVIAVSNQESRPILTGVHFVLEGTQLMAVATDSHRLAQRKVQLPEAIAQRYDVIIPGKSLTELSRMISDGSETVELRIAENQVLFILGETWFYSRLLEGNYPETSRLIPESSETTVELNASSFLASIERASLLSHESRNNVVKLTLGPDANLAKISGNSPDVGNVEEDIQASSLEGAGLEISFNPDYMKDALRSFGQSEIKIAFTSALRPFTLVPTEDEDNFIQLITPVRTY
ncbi:DNA-directed DNA polymerase III subunit beta [Paucilactobacillus vaccinostercus DSM 20634]|jgi:DNA polymerase-3 subunit beta|uniref:Beta sliding clamp n=1 Tax=Paucilactobacillus vaccinostercus DSM 20634 TaxID=1423813 RepID=A0A0R2A137_9LACO|nr:DNA polymerase III subunit beta [Paucilactobacillus vaccinostercus]KRM60663.1 DNA-directed DNA polymerase III subunit beta [Paucilactobacillus vaccinostercus DSM 20634]